jgi:hypothetical protein
VVTVTVGVADGLLEDAQPAAVPTHASAATATASRPDLESPGLESPLLESPLLESPLLESPRPEIPFLEYLGRGTLAPGNTGVPFVCAAPHAPSGCAQMITLR